MAKKNQCILCNHKDSGFFFCKHYEKEPDFDNKNCPAFSENMQPYKKQGLALIILKSVYIFFSFLIITAFLGFNLKPYLRTIQQGELSAVQWMGFPIILLTSFVIFSRFQVSISLFNKIIGSIQVASIYVYESCLGKVGTIFLNLLILFLFLILATISSFLILFGYHLFLCGIWIYLFLCILGALFALLAMTYFSYMSTDIVFANYHV